MRLESAPRPSFWLRAGGGLVGLVSRPPSVTLGVRALVLDTRGLLLVRHTYVAGWYLPGGGIDRAESGEAAIRRELQEEGGILCEEPPVLHGCFRRLGRRRTDHVLCYVVRRFSDRPMPPSDWEIAERRFFPLDRLPADATRATRARLAEVTEGRRPAEDW